MTSKSHSILGHGVVDRLLGAGHEVVHITSIPKEKPVPNLKELNVSSLADSFREEVEKSGVFKLKKVINKGNIADSFIKNYFAYTIHKGLIEDSNVVKLLSDPKEKFDAVILQWFFSELNVGFIQVPAEMWAYNSIYPEIAARREVTLPLYSDAVYNGSLMFVNSYPSIGGAMKLPQNVINIAGYHIQDTVKTLPKNLQTIMDTAKNGVIYFILGSNMKSDGMSEEMKQSLLKMFSKLDQTIIWKFESDMTHTVSNLHLVKWAPQASILAHSNLKLFITHGGQLSTTEAVHYGVPLVGIPIMADQYVNMGSVERKGFGIRVKLAENMADELEAAVRKVLSNETFRAKAKEVSSIFHDRPMKTGAALAHSVEYAVRTRGAPHLRSPAMTVSLYQRLYLDLLVVLVIVAVLVHKLFNYTKRMLSNYSKKDKKE